jgi:hypothetical protein
LLRRSILDLIVQIRVHSHPGTWSYEVRCATESPHRLGLINYLKRRGFFLVLGEDEEARIHVGPLHPEQALAFERGWEIVQSAMTYARLSGEKVRAMSVRCAKFLQCVPAPFAT